MSKLIASCSNCGATQGTFNNESELMLEIAEQKKCERCNSGFDFLNDGRIWNLNIKTISSEEIEMNNLYDFWSIIHDIIVRVAKDRFDDGYYADAAESAFKEINMTIKDIVKTKTGEELDGVSLMRKAFHPTDPVIFLSDLSSDTAKNIQDGYMQIFAGSMMGIRNPKAHGNLTINREIAIHFIFLASLLMYKLEDTTT